MQTFRAFRKGLHLAQIHCNITIVQARVSTPAPTHEDAAVDPWNQQVHTRTVSQKAVMQAQKQKTATSSKRKIEDDNENIPTKKVRMENQYAAEKLQTKYRALKGGRKSDRIAGRPADPLDSRPRGQYNRDETHPGADLAVAQSGILGSSDPAFAEGAPSDSTRGSHISNNEGVDAPRNHTNAFLEVVVSNSSSHKIVRRLVDGHNKWVDRADFLEYGRDGVTELKDRLEDEERD